MSSRLFTLASPPSAPTGCARFSSEVRKPRSYFLTSTSSSPSRCSSDRPSSAGSSCGGPSRPPRPNPSSMPCSPVSQQNRRAAIHAHRPSADADPDHQLALPVRPVVRASGAGDGCCRPCRRQWQRRIRVAQMTTGDSRPLSSETITRSVPAGVPPASQASRSASVIGRPNR